MSGTIFHPGRVFRPSAASAAAADIETAREQARFLEDREAKHAGSVEKARPNVARDIGVNPSTLETLRRGRLKRIDGWIRDRIRALVIREIEREIEALRHELEVLKRVGAQPHSPAVGEVETHLAAARRLIEGMRA